MTLRLASHATKYFPSGLYLQSVIGPKCSSSGPGVKEVPFNL